MRNSTKGSCIKVQGGSRPSLTKGTFFMPKNIPNCNMNSNKNKNMVMRIHRTGNSVLQSVKSDLENHPIVLEHRKYSHPVEHKSSY